MVRRRERTAPGTAVDPSTAPVKTSDSAPPLPLWARLADTLTLALMAVWLRVAIIAPVRFRIGGVRVTVTSHLRLAAAVAIVVIVRHLMWRHPGLHLRVWERVRRWWRVPNAGAVLGAAALSRVTVLLVGLVAVSAFGLANGAPLLTDNPVRNLVARWDSSWYLSILQHGYQWAPDGQQHNVAFFPAFPVGMAALTATLRWHPLHAGLLLSLTAFGLAAAYLYRLARESLDDEGALAAVWLLAAIPSPSTTARRTPNRCTSSRCWRRSITSAAMNGAVRRSGGPSWG